MSSIRNTAYGSSRRRWDYCGCCEGAAGGEERARRNNHRRYVCLSRGRRQV